MMRDGGNKISKVKVHCCVAKLITMFYEEINIDETKMTIVLPEEISCWCWRPGTWCCRSDPSVCPRRDPRPGWWRTRGSGGWGWSSPRWRSCCPGSTSGCGSPPSWRIPTCRRTVWLCYLRLLHCVTRIVPLSQKLFLCHWRWQLCDCSCKTLSLRNWTVNEHSFKRLGPKNLRCEREWKIAKFNFYLR